MLISTRAYNVFQTIIVASVSSYSDLLAKNNQSWNSLQPTITMIKSAICVFKHLVTFLTGECLIEILRIKFFGFMAFVLVTVIDGL